MKRIILGCGILSLFQLGYSSGPESYSEFNWGFPTFPQVANFDPSSQYDHNILDNRTESEVQEEKVRTKRFVNLNIFGNLDVGFLLVIPVMIVLPPMSNLFNTWKYKRSIRSLEELEETYYESDPVFQPQLDTIATYFELIKVAEPHCQQRAICEFSSNPDKYFPIADMFMTQVRDQSLLLYMDRKESDAGTRNSSANIDGHDGLFKLYNQAADIGQSRGEETCHTEFAEKCPFAIEQRLNMPLFKFWKSIEKALDMKIQDKL